MEKKEKKRKLNVDNSSCMDTILYFLLNLFLANIHVLYKIIIYKTYTLLRRRV